MTRDQLAALSLRDPEMWFIVAAYPAYSVSSHGRVRRDAPALGGGGSVRIPSGYLKQRALPSGHMQVTLSMGNRPATVLVHRLVADAFLSAPVAGQDCVLHRDDTPAHNTPSNLFWGTRLDNTADMVAKGRQARGRRVSSCKLSEAAVREIRKAFADGEQQRDIGRRFGIAQSNVSLIVSGRTWGHVQ